MRSPARKRSIRADSRSDVHASRHGARLRRADIIAGLILLALGLLTLFVIIPAEADGDTWSGVSPLFFPTIIASGFCLACVGMLAQAIFRPGSYAGMEAPVQLGRMGFFLLACIIVLGAVFAIHAFGFLWGGPLLVGALILFMGETRWYRIVPMAIVPVLVIYYFVTKLLNAPLP